MTNLPEIGTEPLTQPVTRPVSPWNIANVLTTLRIALVPVLAWALLHDGGDSTTWRWIAFGIFVAAMITDKIDGDIARKKNLVTNFGKIADPIADKAITGMAFVGLAIIMDTWWMWTITIVVLVREWAVTLLRLSVLKAVVIAAAQSGKWKTMAQALALGFLTLPLLEVDGWLDGPGEVTYGAALVLLGLAFVLTLWSGYEFFRDVWKQRHHIRQKAAVADAG